MKNIFNKKSMNFPKFKVSNALKEFTLEPFQTNIIKTQAREEKSIIFGARSIQAQIGTIAARDTVDWDIFTSTPKKSALKTEKKLDNLYGSNRFYTKPALHAGTHKVMNIGGDGRKGTRDDFGVVDYSKMPKPRPRTILIQGNRYRELPTEKARKFKALRDKTQKFRHEKDREDVERIKFITGQKRWERYY